MLPFPVLGISVHISFTPSKTMLQCLSKALTLPKSFLLFRQLIKTCVLFLTDCVKTLSGPVLNSSSSRRSSSSGVISDLALFISAAAILDSGSLFLQNSSLFNFQIRADFRRVVLARFFGSAVVMIRVGNKLLKK